MRGYILMSKSNAAKALATLVWFLLLSYSAQAATIEIEFTSFPVQYGNVSAYMDLYDQASPLGGGVNLATASPMGIVTVSLDDVVVGTYSAGQVYGDLLVSDVGTLNKTGATLFAGDTGSHGLNNMFGFDLLTSAGSLLSLNFNNSDIGGEYRASGSGKPIIVLFGGPISSIVSQNLPDSLQLGSDASISLSGTNFSNVTTSGSAVTGFDVLLTGTITGSLVPEPGTITLVGMGLLAVVAYMGYGRRRANSARPS